MNRYIRALVITGSIAGMMPYGLYLMVEHYMVMVLGEVLLIQPWYIAFEFYVAIPLTLLCVALVLIDYTRLHLKMD